jgi:hypothetical protein
MTYHQSQKSFRDASPVVLLAAGFCVAVAASPALSAPINHGNFPGATVDYLQVTEDANSPGDTPPLFGKPEVTGDTIDFDPVGFNASSAAGVSDLTDGQLLFTVDAKGQARIKTITFAEAGDTTLIGPGTAATSKAVTTTLFVDITEVDNVGINPVTVGPLSMTFSPSGGTYDLAADGVGTVGWTGSILLNMDTLLTNAGVPFVGGATKVDINLDNTLSATSEANSQSLIAKKNANGLTITVNIPEPSSCVMAAMALVGLAARRRVV